MLPILSAGSEPLPAYPLNTVQNLLRLGEKLVELVCPSGNVDKHRLAPTSTMTNRSLYPSELLMLEQEADADKHQRDYEQLQHVP